MVFSSKKLFSKNGLMVKFKYKAFKVECGLRAKFKYMHAKILK